MHGPLAPASLGDVAQLGQGRGVGSRRFMRLKARARTCARDAQREEVPLSPSRRSPGSLALLGTVAGGAGAGGAEARSWRSGSPNRGPPKTKTAMAQQGHRP